MGAKGRVGYMPKEILACKGIPSATTTHLNYATPPHIISSTPSSSSSSFSSSQENMSPKSVILNSSSRLLMAYSNPSSSFSSSSGKMVVVVEEEEEEEGAVSADSKTDMACLRDLMIASDLRERRPTILLAVAETETESSPPTLYPMQEKCECDDNWSWMSSCGKKEGPTDLTSTIITKIDITNPTSKGIISKQGDDGLGQLQYLIDCKADNYSPLVSNDLKVESMSLLDRSPTIQAASARWGQPEDHSSSSSSSSSSNSITTAATQGFVTMIQYQGMKKSLVDASFSTTAASAAASIYPAWDLYPPKPANLAVPESDEADKLMFCVGSPACHSHYPLVENSLPVSFLPDHHICQTRIAPMPDRSAFASQWPEDYVDNLATSLSREIVLPQFEQESIISSTGGKSLLPLAHKVGTISALESSHSVQCNLINRINWHNGQTEGSAEPHLTDIAIQKLNSVAKYSLDHQEAKPLNSPMKARFLVGDSKVGSGMAIMMDAATEITPCVSHREMGTQITPLPSSSVSRSTTPINCTSPSRYKTPTLCEVGATTCISNPIVGFHFGESESYYCSNKELDGLYNNHDRTIPTVIESGVGEAQEQSLERSISAWSSRDEEEEEVGKSLRHFDLDDLRKGFVDARACAWLEAERAKCQARYARQEAKIEAWEKQEMAKTEAEHNKFEEVLRKMRSRMNEKVMKKKAATHRKADEMRASAQAEQMQEEAKAVKRADRIRRTGHFPSHFSPYACFF